MSIDKQFNRIKGNLIKMGESLARVSFDWGYKICLEKYFERLRYLSREDNLDINRIVKDMSSELEKLSN